MKNLSLASMSVEPSTTWPSLRGRTGSVRKVVGIGDADKVNKAELRKVAHADADRSAAEVLWLSVADSDPSGDAR